MRPAVIVSAVLGAGCALVFAAAALTAALFPNGTLVSGGWNGGMRLDMGFKGGAVMPANGIALPVPAPGVIGVDRSTVITGGGPVVVVAPVPQVPVPETATPSPEP